MTAVNLRASPAAKGWVEVWLIGSGGQKSGALDLTADKVLLDRVARVQLDATGLATVDLLPTASITPAGTVYRADFNAGGVKESLVFAGFTGVGPVEAVDHIVDVPGALLSPAAALAIDAEEAARIAADAAHDAALATKVPLPAVAPTVGQVLAAIDTATPPTTDWVDAATGGGDPADRVNAAADFGFLGDGTAADLDRFQAAAAAAIAAGQPLYVPAGTYTLNFQAADTSVAITGSLSVIGAGRAQTVLNVGPNQPTFAYELFRLASLVPWFEVRDITINGPADPTTGGADFHDRNKLTACVWAQTSSATRQAGKMRFERVKIGGKFFEALTLSNGDLDLDFVDCDITAYSQCVSNFDSSTTTSNLTYGRFFKTERWFRTLRTHFHDAGIPPWTAGEDAGGVADTTGNGHLIYPHPNVNTYLGPGTRFSGGVAGKYAYAIHTGSGVQGSARQCIADGVLFEGPGGGLESNERGLTEAKNCTFTCRTGILLQNDLEAVGCTFEDSAVGFVTGAARSVRFRSCSFTCRSFRERHDAQMTFGSAVLTLPANSKDKHFTASDVGRTVVVFGAGATGQPLVTKVSAFTSSSQVTVADAASTTVTAARHMVGRTQMTSTHLTPDLSGALWQIDDCDFLFEDDSGGVIVNATSAADRVTLSATRFRSQPEFQVAMTAGSPTVTATTGVFTIMDIGKVLLVYGASGGGIHAGTITGWTSTSTVTLSANATTTVSAARAMIRSVSGKVTLNGSRVSLSRVLFEGTINGSSYWLRAANAALVELELDDVRFGRMGNGGDPMEIASVVAAGRVRGRASFAERNPLFGSAQYLTGRVGLWPTAVASAATVGLNWSADTYHVTGVTTIDNLFVGSEAITGTAGSTKGFAGTVRLIMDSTAAFSAAGNIRPATTAASVANSVRTFQYDPATALWYEAA